VRKRSARPAKALSSFGLRPEKAQPVSADPVARKAGSPPHIKPHSYDTGNDMWYLR